MSVFILIHSNEIASYSDFVLCALVHHICHLPQLLSLAFIFVMSSRSTEFKFGMSAWGKAGTVLGLWLDSRSGAFRVTTNGDFTPPNGGTVIASGLVPSDEVGSGLFPAVSAEGCTIQVNLGKRPFRFQPPDYPDTLAAALAAKPQVHSRLEILLYTRASFALPTSAAPLRPSLY